MDCENSPHIQTIYEPKAKTSTLPIRKAAAVVIRNSEEKILVVRRSNLVDEFKGNWSFPSVFVDEGSHMMQAITQRLLSWFMLEIRDVELIGKRMGIRPAWRILMHLFSAHNCNEPKIRTNKYDDLKWVDGRQYFSQYHFDKLGECSKAYLDYLNRDVE